MGSIVTEAIKPARAAPSSARGPLGGVLLLSCVGVDLELGMLPHFLEHYLALGIPARNVRVILNSRDPGSPGLDAADRLLARHGAPRGRRWIAPYTSEAMWAERRALQAEVAGTGDWIVNADVDELHEYPAPIGEVIAELERTRRNCVQGVMIDRLAPDGSLAPVRPGEPLAAQFPLRADVSLSVIGTGENHGVSGTIKLMLHRHDVLPRRGGHTIHDDGAPARYAAGNRLSVFPGAREPDWRARFPFRVHHYKWTQTLRESLDRRLATEGVSVAGREYGGKIDRYLAAHDRIRLEDASLFEDPPGAGAGDGGWRARLAALRRSAPYWTLRNAVRLRVQLVRGALHRRLGR